MKKIIISTVVTATLAMAANNGTYELTPMFGHVDTGKNVDIKTHKVFGVAVGFNQDDNCKFDQIEVGILHTQNSEYTNGAKTKVTQLLVNGIKEYKMDDNFKLFALAGLGYEKISNEQMDNDSGGLFEYGVGAKYKIAKSLSLRADIRHQLKFDKDQNVVYLIGLAMPFGGEKKSTPAKKPEIKVKPVMLDDDMDGVINEHDSCKDTPRGANISVDVYGCELDSDNDGLVNSKDMCPLSKKYAYVDDKGCEVVTAKELKALQTPADLGILFNSNSDIVKSNDLPKFDKYVKYLKSVPTSQIVIEAHTDSLGAAAYNLALSKKRAFSAKKILVDMGISANRIEAYGYGETSPLVPNDTKANRQKNRRVTARIIK